MLGRFKSLDTSRIALYFCPLKGASPLLTPMGLRAMLSRHQEPFTTNALDRPLNVWRDRQISACYRHHRSASTVWPLGETGKRRRTAKDMQEPSEALILGIDTTGPVDNVALVRGEHVVASLSRRQAPMSSRPLLRLIDVLCAQAQRALTDVTALAVNVGPGAFTGLRVGLATAQGLAVAYGKPLVGCTAFEALLTLVPGWQGDLCPVVQARKGEVYVALYHMDGDPLTAVEKLPGMVVAPEALCAMIHERTLFFGSGVTAYRTVLTAALSSDAVCLDLVEASTGLAASVARWGVAREEQPSGYEADPWRVQPLYIRPADARLPRIAANAAGATSMATGGAAPSGSGRITE